MIGQFTATYMKDGKWYVGFIQEVPSVNTQGKTLAEVKRNLKEALVMVLEANRELSHRIKGSHRIEEPLNIALQRSQILP